MEFLWKLNKAVEVVKPKSYKEAITGSYAITAWHLAY